MTRRVPAPLAALALLLLFSAPAAAAAQGASSGAAPAATLEKIASLLATQNLPAAASAADAALRTYPNDPALHNLSGVIAAQWGTVAEAAEHFERAIQLSPRAAAAYENLGRLYQEQAHANPGAPAKALDAYRRLLAIDPAHAEALFQSAVLFAHGGRFAESTTVLDRLPRQVRELPNVLAVLAVALAGTGEPAAAVAAASRVAAHPRLAATDVLPMLHVFDRLGDIAPALQMLEALDRRGLAPPDALHQLGRLYMRAGRPAEAVRVLERAASDRPGVPLLVDLARAASKAGDHEQALGFLGHARTLEPDNAEVHFLFGIVCVQLDLVAEAHASLSKAVALAPDSAAANYAMGAVSMHRRDPSESIPYFEKYVQLVSGDPRGRFALGAARFYAGDLEGARRDLWPVADRPETAAGANYFLARIARQANDLEEARRAIDKALEAAPANADAWAELGLLQMRAGEFGEAEASLRKALSIAPDNYQATVNLTALYTKTRDPRRAAQAAALAALQEKREQYAQELLRMIEVVPR